jgi:hypothetical protein
MLLLDVPIDSAVEFAFVRALIPRAHCTGTEHRAPQPVPFGDIATMERL